MYFPFLPRKPRAVTPHQWWDQLLRCAGLQITILFVIASSDSDSVSLILAPFQSQLRFNEDYTLILNAGNDGPPRAAWVLDDVDAATYWRLLSYLGLRTEHLAIDEEKIVNRLSPTAYVQPPSKPLEIEIIPHMTEGIWADLSARVQLKQARRNTR